MSEKVKVDMREQVVIPQKLRKKHHIEEGIIVEINKTEDGLLLKPFNPVVDLKGIGKGVFGDPLKHQRKLREE
ncbi:MAG: AbrB/MazE/SpoVT family DNA-binding domain-containing protein [Candidatus Bathyarchaeia archaeon]|jgi:AbrB family looped-hinge helix DNA binding protein